MLDNLPLSQFILYWNDIEGKHTSWSYLYQRPRHDDASDFYERARYTDGKRNSIVDLPFNKYVFYYEECV